MLQAAAGVFEGWKGCMHCRNVWPDSGAAGMGGEYVNLKAHSEVLIPKMTCLYPHCGLIRTDEH